MYHTMSANIVQSILDANKVRYESVLRTVITRMQKHVANVYIADYATFGIGGLVHKHV